MATANNAHYMRLHARALFTANEKDELIAVREPWDCVSQMAPRFYLARPLHEKPFACFRAGVPETLKERLTSVAGREPALESADEPPVYRREYLQLLNAAEASEEVCFEIPRQQNLSARILTARDIGNRAERYFPWLAGELKFVPFCAAVCMEDTQVVSVCRSVRIIPGAEEAGIETCAPYRRKGYALSALAAWTQRVRESGAIPLYSAHISNTASINLAKKAGGILFGKAFSIR